MNCVDFIIVYCIVCTVNYRIVFVKFARYLCIGSVHCTVLYCARVFYCIWATLWLCTVLYYIKLGCVWKYCVCVLYLFWVAFDYIISNWVAFGAFVFGLYWVLGKH